MSRYTAHVETEVSGETFILDTETQHRAWFGDTPIFMMAEIAEMMNTVPGYAARYAWVDDQFDLVEGP